MLRRSFFVGLLVIAALLLVGRFAAAAYVDYLWFAALGAQELWALQFRNQAILCVASATVAMGFLFANLYAVRQSVVSLVLPRRLGNLEIGEEVPGRYLTQLALGASVVLGLLLSLPRSAWLEFAAARHAVPFRERDPVFDYDLSYFVNWLPFEKALFSWCMILLIAVTVLVLLLYALTPSLRWDRGEGLRVTLYVRRHVGVLAAVALLVLAWSFRLEMLDTLLTGSGVEGAFGATDRVMVGARTMLTFVTMLAAFLLAWAIWTDQVRLAFFCLTCVLLVSLTVNVLTPVIVRESTQGEELAVTERQYLGIRAGRTRRAFALDEIIPAEPHSSFAFPGLAAVTAGVPLWDPEQFQRAAEARVSGAERNGNAGFVDSRDGQLIQTVVRTPHAPGSRVPASWLLVRALAGSTLPDGSPRPAPGGDSPVALRPMLLSNPAAPFLVVSDSLNRILAPSIESPMSRLAHAWSRQDFRMLFTDPPRPNPRALLYADVRERLRRIAPFFEPDSQVYPVTHADTLYWVVQMYSHSNSYPLSHPVALGGRTFRYFRRAATALLNSETGKVSLYVSDATDPLAQTWMAAAPSLFTTITFLPGDLAGHLPPAVDGALAQAIAYSKYGVLQDSISGGTPAPAFSGDSAAGRPQTSMVHIPSLAPSGAWIQPLLDATGRMHRLLIAAGGSTPRTYRIAIEPGLASWREKLRRFDEVRDSIDAHDELEVVSGPVRAVPVGNEVILLRTFYSLSQAAIPGAIAVSVMRGDSIYTSAGLAQAVGVAPVGAPETALTPEQFASRVKALHETMRAALRRGDFVAFGDAFNALGSLLSRVPR